LSKLYIFDKVGLSSAYPQWNYHQLQAGGFITDWIRLPPEAGPPLAEKTKHIGTEILTRENPKNPVASRNNLRTVCILKSSPEGEGFSPWVRQ